MKTSYKLVIFDVDVGNNVHEEAFNDVVDASREADSVLSSYEVDPSFADDRELDEAKEWDCEDVVNALEEVLFSKFFDSVSIWFPGHHRKITITKTEENN